jgi:hypothetical protein
MGHICDDLHQLFHNLPVYSFPFSLERIPRNGVYVLFEKGEKGHGTDRIVRIGAHTGIDQLRPRLLQHYINENKDRSIFRKNIGRAILNRDGDPFLKQWNWDLTSKAAREEYQDLIDLSKLKQIEQIVSQTIQENFRFVVFRVDNIEERLGWEGKIISTVSLCSDCHSSTSWLGRHSPVEKIRESGLWNIQGLYKEGVSERDFDQLGSLIDSLS